ncbi:MAG: NUDIX domain-containing protein, partial [Bacteroidota bacterium]
ALANELLGKHQPDIFNQAIMEFGSKQCKPVSPDCQSCPLQTTCYAFTSGKVNTLPVKSKKTKIRKRFFHYILIREKDNFFIRQRKEKDIWTGLHDFPLIETAKPESSGAVITSEEWKSYFGERKSEITNISNEHRHILSHQHIHATFYEIRSDLKTFNEKKENWKKVNSESVKEFAVPRLIEEYLKQM